MEILIPAFHCNFQRDKGGRMYSEYINFVVECKIIEKLTESADTVSLLLLPLHFLNVYSRFEAVKTISAQASL